MTGESMAGESMPEEPLYRGLKKSKKYRDLCDDTLKRTAQWALKRFRGKEALKAAKNKLHQVYGAYFTGLNLPALEKRLDRLIADTVRVPPGDIQNTHLKNTCLEILKSHTSSSERLGIMEDFYGAFFADRGAAGSGANDGRSILDLACGLNPFTVPWMGPGPGTSYHAVEINHRLVAQLNRFLEYLRGIYPGARFGAQCADILVTPPTQEVDMVFLFKVLPCLEQQQKGISRELLTRLKARQVVVSFPSRSLTGKSKGMAEYYDEFFSGLVRGLGFRFTKMEYPNELFYVVTR